MTSMDGLVLKEAEKHGMCVREVDGTRTTISNLEGVIFDITLKWYPALRFSFVEMLEWSWRSVEVPCSRKISWRCGGCVAPEDTIPCRYSSIFINDGLQRICWFGVIFYLAAMSFSLMRSVNWLNSRVLLLQLSQAIYLSVRWPHSESSCDKRVAESSAIIYEFQVLVWILKKLCITMSSCLV